MGPSRWNILRRHRPEATPGPDQTVEPAEPTDAEEDSGQSRRSFARKVAVVAPAAVAARVLADPSAAGATAAGSWSLTGNAGTTPPSNYLGTADSQALVFATNGTERARLTASGQWAMNVPTPFAALHIRAGSQAVFRADYSGTGASPAITANTAGTAANATAVMATVTPTTAGAGSAAVLGANKATSANGAGVVGQHSGTGTGVQGTAASGGKGVSGSVPNQGYGVWGSSVVGYGVYGTATNSSGAGVGGAGADSGIGVIGTVPNQGLGVKGQAGIGTGVSGISTNSAGIGVSGTGADGGVGVRGSVPDTGYAVRGSALTGYGSFGSASSGVGVGGTATTGFGMSGLATGTDGVGVIGTATADGSIAVKAVQSAVGAQAIHATSTNTGGVAVWADGANDGVYATALGSGTGVSGLAQDTGMGVYGQTANTGYGVYGVSQGDGIGVYGTVVDKTNGLAAQFEGPVKIDGFLTVVGTTPNGGIVADAAHITNATIDHFQSSDKHFRIDHPQDPAGHYLIHSCVESPERLNLYTGTVELDAGGRARVELPSYFDALNTTPLIQLTGVGAGHVFVAEDQADGAFEVGGDPGQKVYWQVSGVRQDAWAEAHPIDVEEPKAADDVGHYVNPEVHGFGPDRRITSIHRPATAPSPN